MEANEQEDKKKKERDRERESPRCTQIPNYWNRKENNQAAEFVQQQVVRSNPACPVKMFATRPHSCFNPLRSGHEMDHGLTPSASRRDTFIGLW